MESDTGDRVEIISGIASSRHVVEAMLASAMALQLYDWLLTLPREVEYIWRADWNWSKVLYLLTRYMPFITIALVIRNQFALDPTPESCKRTLQAICWLALIGLDLAEVVLAVRTYAVWERDKRVGIGLALLLALYQIPDVIILNKFIQGTSYTRNPYPELHRGCVYNKANRLVYANWLIITIVEGVVLVLMIISATKAYHKHTSNLMHVVYRDGIRFYLYIFCATLANVLITLLLPADFITVGSDIEIVIHSILACRLMIGIREATKSYASGCKSETFEVSEVYCINPIEFTCRASSESAQMDLEACVGVSKSLTSCV